MIDPDLPRRCTPGPNASIRVEELDRDHRGGLLCCSVGDISGDSEVFKDNGRREGDVGIVFGSEMYGGD